jgi:hypothetical protein
MRSVSLLQKKISIGIIEDRQTTTISIRSLKGGGRCSVKDGINISGCRPGLTAERSRKDKAPGSQLDSEYVRIRARKYRPDDEAQVIRYRRYLF